MSAALRDTYAARWKSLNLGEVLGESEAGEERGGHNEALHGVCLCECWSNVGGDAL